MATKKRQVDVTVRKRITVQRSAVGASADNCRAVLNLALVTSVHMNSSFELLPVASSLKCSSVVNNNSRIFARLQNIPSYISTDTIISSPDEYPSGTMTEWSRLWVHSSGHTVSYNQCQATLADLLTF